MCERFAIEGDAGFFQSADELAVGILFIDGAQGCVDLHIPETAEFDLFIAAMGESIGTSMGDGLISGALCF